MSNGNFNFDIRIDRNALDYFKREMPEKLVEAREKMVEAAGMVWADDAKRITRDDDHIQTGLYINSLGYNTGSPANESDVVNEIKKSGSKTTLTTGSNVAYAASLEKRFNIQARALDQSADKMGKVAETAAKRILF